MLFTTEIQLRMLNSSVNLVRKQELVLEQTQMDRKSIKKWVVISAVTATSLIIPGEANACFLDWFRRREPTTSYYPPAAAAPTGASCGAAYCEQTVLRYVPQVAYRTVWQPVPVTTYRRTVSYNPSSGLPMTCTQPCTTYTYQARRVPYTSFRPVYTQVPVTNGASGCNSCQTAIAPPATATPYYQSPPAAQPAFTPSTGSLPTTSEPPGASPWEPVQQAVPSPAATNGGYPAPPPTTTDPADDRPRIDPQAADFSSIQRVPSTVANNSFSIAPNNTAPPQPESSSITAADPFNRRTPNLGSATNSAASDGSAQSNWTSEPANPNFSRSAPTTTDLDIRPIPKINTQPSEATRSAPPVLNQPRLNTALLQTIPTEWASNRIQWSEQQVSHNVSTDIDETWKSATPRRLDPHRLQDSDPSPQWDTSGWRSARQ